MTREAMAYGIAFVLMLFAVAMFSRYFYPRLFRAGSWRQVIVGSMLELSPYLIAILVAWWFWPR
jgi:4-hydroxybenzoate polyprenyltransferase